MSDNAAAGGADLATKVKPEDNTGPLLDFPTMDVALEWVAAMSLIREFESRLDALCLAGEIPGSVHLAIGQEAVAVGANRALEKADVITTSHRPHHHALAKGISPRAAMAELFGKATGTSGGRGGTMHLTDFQHGYYPGNAIVGASVGIAGGAALAMKLRGEKTVACTFFGDGAINTGRTWEALNLASIWDLPLIAICENNYYAVETYSRDMTGGDSVSRAASFGLASFSVDGQDVSAMLDAVQQARERAVAGEGPTFIEARTYRFQGHSTGETIAYRTTDEEQLWISNADPIERLTQAIVEHDASQAAKIDAIHADAIATIDDAIAFARGSDDPAQSTAYLHVNGLDWVPYTEA